LIPIILINGHPVADIARAIAGDERGFHYGDGLFETALLTGGRIRFLDDHLDRLMVGCEQLRLPGVSRALLQKEIDRLTEGHGEGILKIMVTRGRGGRGYRPPEQPDPMRILTLYPPPELSRTPDAGIAVRWCALRLARSPALAGIKHLNRLEQVLAQAEWTDAGIAEGLLLDTEGELVSATASNLFLVREGQLITPDLRYCGIKGVMRGRVIVTALEAGIPVEEQPLWSVDLEAAEEVFLTNAIRGIQPVARVDQTQWQTGPVTRKLAAALGLW